MKKYFLLASIITALIMLLASCGDIPIINSSNEVSGYIPAPFGTIIVVGISVISIIIIIIKILAIRRKKK